MCPQQRLRDLTSPTAREQVWDPQRASGLQTPLRQTTRCLYSTELKQGQVKGLHVTHWVMQNRICRFITSLLGKRICSTPAQVTFLRPLRTAATAAPSSQGCARGCFHRLLTLASSLLKGRNGDVQITLQHPISIPENEKGVRIRGHLPIKAQYSCAGVGEAFLHHPNCLHQRSHPRHRWIHSHCPRS